MTLTFGKRTAESSRGAFAGKLADTEDLPVMIADSEAAAVSVFRAIPTRRRQQRR